jgi:hypothetical protein
LQTSQATDHGQIAADRDAGRVKGALWQEADAGRMETRELQPTAVWKDEAHDHAQEGCLARAIRPQEAKDGTCRDVKGKLVKS